MSDVKRVGERLECMLFRARFKEEVDELKPVSQLVHLYTAGCECIVIVDDQCSHTGLKRSKE